jgi:HSP20 family protein
MKSSTAAQHEKQQIAVQAGTPEALLEEASRAFDAISRRAFEIFESNGRLNGHDVDDWLKAEAELYQPVTFDISDAGPSLSVKTQVPGFTEKELTVSAEPRHLAISGRHESSQERRTPETVQSETWCKRLFRMVELPTEIDAAKVTAKLEDGVLAISMPKASKALPARTQAVA